MVWKGRVQEEGSRRYAALHIVKTFFIYVCVVQLNQIYNNKNIVFELLADLAFVTVI